MRKPSVLPPQTRKSSARKVNSLCSSGSNKERRIPRGPLDEVCRQTGYAVSREFERTIALLRFLNWDPAEWTGQTIPVTIVARSAREKCCNVDGAGANDQPGEVLRH